MKKNEVNILQLNSNKNNRIAVLIDPEKWKLDYEFDTFISSCNSINLFCILVGGSTKEEIGYSVFISYLKSRTHHLIIGFPGHTNQLSNQLDALLYLNLISGNNPDYLINLHVESAFEIYHSGLTSISTSYLLIDGGIQTSTLELTKTTPLLPTDKEKIIRTVIAGQLIGHSCCYLEAGSGAKYPIKPELISEIKLISNQTLIVGGGINNIVLIKELLTAGADLIVIGNFLEKHPDFLEEISLLNLH